MTRRSDRSGQQPEALEALADAARNRGVKSAEAGLYASSTTAPVSASNDAKNEAGKILLNSGVSQKAKSVTEVTRELPDRTRTNTVQD